MHQASWAPGGQSCSASFDSFDSWMQPPATQQLFTSTSNTHEFAHAAAAAQQAGCAAFVDTASAAAQPQQQRVQQQLPGHASFSPAAANVQLQADLAALQSMQQQLSLQGALAQQLLQRQQHGRGGRVSDGGHAPDGGVRGAPLGAPGAAAGAAAGTAGAATAMPGGAAAGTAAGPVGGAAAAAAAAGAAAGAAAAAAGSAGAPAGDGGALALSPAAALAAPPAAPSAAPGCSASLASLMFESARSVYQRALAEARTAAETLASASAAVEAAQASLAAASEFITQMMNVNSQLADPAGTQGGSTSSNGRDQQVAAAAAACSRRKQKAKKRQQQVPAAAAPSVPLPSVYISISEGMAMRLPPAASVPVLGCRNGRARSVSMGTSSSSYTGAPTTSEPALHQQRRAGGACTGVPHAVASSVRPLGKALSEPIPVAAAAATAALTAPVAFNVLAELDDLADNWLEGLPPLSPATTDALAQEAASLPASTGCDGLVLPAPLPQQAYTLLPPVLPAAWPATSHNGSESPTKKRRTSPCAASPAAAASPVATPASTGRCGSTEAADSVETLLDNMLCNMVQAAPDATLSAWQSVLQQHGLTAQQPQLVAMQHQLQQLHSSMCEPGRT